MIDGLRAAHRLGVPIGGLFADQSVDAISMLDNFANVVAIVGLARDGTHFVLVEYPTIEVVRACAHFERTHEAWARAKLGASLHHAIAKRGAEAVREITNFMNAHHVPGLQPASFDLQLNSDGTLRVTLPTHHVALDIVIGDSVKDED